MINLQDLPEIYTMRHATSQAGCPPGEVVPQELTELMDRVRALPPEIREELMPAVNEAIEQSKFRSRILGVARDALERLRLDLTMTQFDLEVTRRERDDLRTQAG